MNVSLCWENLPFRDFAGCLREKKFPSGGNARTRRIMTTRGDGARHNLARRLDAPKRERERKIRLLFAGVLAFDPLASHFDGVHFE